MSKCRIAPAAPQVCRLPPRRRRRLVQVNGTPLPTLKRQPKGPRTEGFILENVKAETITAIPCKLIAFERPQISDTAAPTGCAGT